MSETGLAESRASESAVAVGNPVFDTDTCWARAPAERHVTATRAQRNWWFFMMAPFV
jgi:hypothetical protein